MYAVFIILLEIGLERGLGLKIDFGLRNWILGSDLVSWITFWIEKTVWG